MVAGQVRRISSRSIERWSGRPFAGVAIFDVGATPEALTSSSTPVRREESAFAQAYRQGPLATLDAKSPQEHWLSIQVYVQIVIRFVFDP
jgi:hypothetical protein